MALNVILPSIQEILLADRNVLSRALVISDILIRQA